MGRNSDLKGAVLVHFGAFWVDFASGPSDGVGLRIRQNLAQESKEPGQAPDPRSARLVHFSEQFSSKTAEDFCHKIAWFSTKTSAVFGSPKTTLS